MAHALVTTLTERVAEVAALAESAGPERASHALTLKDLQVRARKLAYAWDRPPCLGFFGPSQAGKSFLVGALLAHELGGLDVLCREGSVDFLKEINPAKGVESTGVVTRFTTSVGAPLEALDFYCQLLNLESVLESLATGFLVECTSPALDTDRIERCLRDARLQVGPVAPPAYAEAWDAVFHSLSKKYQDRHPYLNELRRQSFLQSGAWKSEIRTVPGWLHAYSLLWGGPGYAPDVDRLMGLLAQGLDAVGHAPGVEVALDHVRASSHGVSVIDASCLNALGTPRGPVKIRARGGAFASRDVSVEPGILSALIAEIRLVFRGAPGSLLERSDILDFPGGRALKGINGFGQAELTSGKLENAIEVYKRGKLTFLFEQFSLDREITALVLCSPGPTKPEAIQLQSQVEGWLRIRYGAQTPSAAHDVASPSLFLALTKYDMSLGVLRSDNARDRWESRVQEACVDFWARNNASWIVNWGGKGQPFTNLFWIRNPHADQMRSLKPSDADFAAVKAGYLEARAVQRHVARADEKWAAVEGDDDRGLPKSGIPLLAAHLREKLSENVKARELNAEAALVRTELLSVLRALTPARDEVEERARLLENAKALSAAVTSEMARRCTGSVFGELVRLLSAPEDELEAEVRKAHALVAPMSIKASDKVKKVLVHVLKWWTTKAQERYRASDGRIPAALIDDFIRQVCTSRSVLQQLGNAVFPYFTRNIVDCSIVATIIAIKVSDGMVHLFVEDERATPTVPVCLSYAEDVPTAGDGPSGVDWGDVDFSDDSGEERADGVEIIFAGSRYFKRWGERLGDLYIGNSAKAGAGYGSLATADAATQRLTSVLGEIEKLDVATLA